MKKKDVLIKRLPCECNELDTVAELLEQKAADGWELTSKTGNAFGFRRCEPRKVKVSVELVCDCNDDERETFIEACEKAGWKHIFNDGKYQFFETEDLSAEPIHSDPAAKLALVHKKCMGMRVVFPAACALFAFFFWRKFMLPLDVDTLMGTYNLFGFILFPSLGFLMALTMLDYFIWYRKARRCISEGKNPVYKRTRISKFCDRFMVIYVFFGMMGSLLIDAIYMENAGDFIGIVVMFLAVIFFMIFFPRLSAKTKTDRKGNLPQYMVLITIVILSIAWFQVIFLQPGGEMIKTAEGEYIEVYDEKIPLTMEDLGIKTGSYTDRYKLQSGSPVIQYFEGSDNSDNENKYYLWYWICTTKNSKAYDMLIKEKHYDFINSAIKAEDPAFEANAVYYNDSDARLLLYDNFIVKIITNIELTDEQKHLVASKLKANL